MQKTEYTVNEIFENQILNDIYETRGDGLECVYIRMYGKPEEVLNCEKAEDEFRLLAKQTIKDEEIKKQILDKFNQFQDALLGEMTLWDKQYYKLGFLDGIYLKKEIRYIKKILSNYKTTDNKNENGFFYKYIDSILQFIEDNRFSIWRKRKDYKKVKNKMSEIKDKYPNIRTFVEDRVFVELDREELKALLQYIDLDDKIKTIEKVETFKLGLKEGNSL